MNNTKTNIGIQILTALVLQAGESRKLKMFLRNSGINPKPLPDAMEFIFNAMKHFGHPNAKTPEQLAKAVRHSIIGDCERCKTSLREMMRDYSNAKIEEFLDAHLRDFGNPSLGIPFNDFTEPDPVNHPAHYLGDGIECIDAIRAALGTEGFIAFCRGNVIKYSWRSSKKGNASEDMAKAAWYATKAKEEM